MVLQEGTKPQCAFDDRVFHGREPRKSGVDAVLLGKCVRHQVVVLRGSSTRAVRAYQELGEHLSMAEHGCRSRQRTSQRNRERLERKMTAGQISEVQAAEAGELEST